MKSTVFSFVRVLWLPDRLQRREIVEKRTMDLLRERATIEEQECTVERRRSLCWIDERLTINDAAM